MSEKCNQCGKQLAVPTNLWCPSCDTMSELPAPTSYLCYAVNKNTNYEHEVIGIYNSIEKAREHCEKAGMSAWITEHKMNVPGIGMHI